MKKLYVGVAAAGVALFVMGAGTSSQAITTQGDVQANILSALSLTKVDTLDFGSIMSGTTSSVIRIAANSGVRTLESGNAALVTGGNEQDGTFELDGVPFLNVLVDIPTSVTVSDGTNNMTVSNFAWSYDNGLASGVDGVVALGLGAASLSIGADLTVGANQPAGGYTGTYSVTVNYQ